MTVTIESADDYTRALIVFELLWRSRPEPGSDDARALVEYAEAIAAFTGEPPAPMGE